MSGNRQDYEAAVRARLNEARKREKAVKDDSSDDLSFLPALFAGLAVALLINAVLTLMPA